MEETAKHSTENMWFWPSCFLIPFPLAPGFTYLRLFVWKLLMLVSDSSLSYISFLLLPFILFHVCLTSLTNCSPFFFHSTVPPTCSLPLSLLCSVCWTSLASPPLPAPPPQGQEGAQEAQEARAQGGRAPWRIRGPGPQPRPLLNQNEKYPFPFFSCAANCSFPVSLSSRPPVVPKHDFTLYSQKLSKPLSLHHTAQPLAPPMALQDSLHHIVNFEACRSVLPGITRTLTNLLCTIFTVRLLFSVSVFCLSPPL